jgi:hypothetical protein
LIDSCLHFLVWMVGKQSLCGVFRFRSCCFVAGFLTTASMLA